MQQKNPPNHQRVPLTKIHYKTEGYETKPDPFYGTTNGFGNLKNAGHRIDYVFTKKIEVKSAKHLYKKTPLDGWASDHHAVVATLELIE